jgi:L-asparagine oxygenase
MTTISTPRADHSTNSFIGYDFRFSPAETEAYRDALMGLSSPYEDYGRFLGEVSQLHAAGYVPARFADFCEASMLRNFAEEPYIVIGGAPIDPHLPRFGSADPVNDKYQLKNTFVAEGFLAAYAVLTGTDMIGHLSVNNGDMFHDIYPKESMFGTQSQKTLGTLKFHRDFTNHFVCPDFVNTLTLRDTPRNEVYSTFAITRRAIQDLSDRDVEILHQIRFYTPYDDVSVSNSAVRLGRARDHAVLLEAQGAKVFEGRTEGLDAEAQEALDNFMVALHRHKQLRISLPGDSVTFSNHHVIHGREVHEIHDAESLKQRWLLKTHNVYSLRAFEDFFLADRYGVVNG